MVKIIFQCSALKYIYEIIVGIPSSHHSINIIYISLISILGGSVLLSCTTWLRLLIGLMKSPKSKIMRFLDHSSRLNESSLYRLKKQVRHFFVVVVLFFFLRIQLF